MSGAVVVIGVTGCGKSTLAAALAAALGWAFIDGDALEPPVYVTNTKAGERPDDADRELRFSKVSRELARHHGAGVVVAYSALLRRYRDAIREQAGNVHFVLPEVAGDRIAARIEKSASHQMPAGLIDSELATFDQPETDENAIVVDGTLPTGEQVRRVLDALSRRGIVPAADRQQGQQQQ